MFNIQRLKKWFTRNKRINYMSKKLFLFFLFIIASKCFAQQPIFKLDSLSANPGDSINISLTGENISNIGAITIKINYDSTVLTWVKAINWNDNLRDGLAGTVDNKITIAWDGLEGIKIASGKIVDLKFYYIGKISELNFDTTLTEIANLEGVPIKSIFIDGYISPITNVSDNYKFPDQFSLSQNYPNPFNPSTIISYALPKETPVSIRVYNMIGQEVAALINQTQPAGNYEVNFDGSKLSSGVYFYKLKAGQYSETKKMILMK